MRYGISIRQLLTLALALSAALAAAGLFAAATSRRGAVAELENVATDGVIEPPNTLSLPIRLAALSLKEPDLQLVMPVEGVSVRQVADTWGAARDGRRQHSGQDIFARRGTPVRSATEGYVLRVGESPRGGKTVFVMGAGGRRYYYAHLDEHAEGLAAGAYVTADSLLGYVGTTGNAVGTPPHLHFGVYTAAGAINPLPLLADRA